MNSSRARSKWSAIGVTVAMVLTSVVAIAAPAVTEPAGANGSEPACTAVKVLGNEVGTACPASGTSPLAVHITATGSPTTCTPLSVAGKPDDIRVAYGDGEFIYNFNVTWQNNNPQSGVWCSSIISMTADHAYSLPLYVPSATYTAQVQFRYGTSWYVVEPNAFQIRVKEANRAPIAVNDTHVLAPEATSAVVDVLANDHDPDGDPIRVSSLDPITTHEGGTATCTQSDCTWSAPPGPPIENDFFEYTISDGFGGSATGVVHIGQPAFDATLRVVGINDDTGEPVPGYVLTGCSNGSCLSSVGGAATRTFPDQVTGTWRLSVIPPPGFEAVEWGQTAELTSGDTTTVEFRFRPPQPPPPAFTVSGDGTIGGLPSVPVGRSTPFTVSGCVGGTFTVIVDGVSTPMTEISPGLYAATINPSTRGLVAVTVERTCPSVATTTDTFDVNAYIDPSGFVSTSEGAPLAGATVTLYRSDFAVGPFELVPDQSTIMSPKNRTNSDLTDATGHFGWDVIAGYYKVRAAYPGCTDITGSLPFVETGVLEIPPEVTDLDIRLTCPGAVPNVAPSVRVQAPARGVEGVPLTLRGSVNDYEHDPLTLAWSATPGLGVDPGATCTFTSPGSSTTKVQCTDDGVYEVALDVADATHNASESATLVVANRKPTVTPIATAPPRIGASVTIDSLVTDAGSSDTLSCTVDFDGPGDARAPVVGTVTAGHCRATSSYATAGTYTARVNVSDDDGGTAAANLSVVAYNPNALVIFTTSLPNAKKGQAYSAKLAALGGKGTLKWKKLSKLPQGLRLAPKTGVISGAPKKAGTVSFGVQVSDQSRPKKIVKRTLSIRVT